MNSDVSFGGPGFVLLARSWMATGVAAVQGSWQPARSRARFVKAVALDTQEENR